MYSKCFLMRKFYTAKINSLIELSKFICVKFTQD
jgi:hypothetical protein